MPRGGKRPGAGKPKGYKHANTLDKLAARELLRTRVTAELLPMIDAQIQNAKGISHLFVRDENGKFVQITEVEKIEQVLNSGEQDKYFYIHTKDPSIQAFSDLMNRALDKPKEQEIEIKVSGELEIVASRLMAARKRLAEQS